MRPDAKERLLQFLDRVHSREHLGHETRLRGPRAPCRIAGTIPALTTEDFPAPLGPTTARNLDPRPVSLSRAIRRAVSSVRPKKSWASASVNGLRPLYGLRTSSLLGVAIVLLLGGRACGISERFRAGCFGSDVRSLDEFPEARRRVVVKNASSEGGELADVIGRVRSRPDADLEVPEVGVPFPVEQHVGVAHPPVCDMLSVCVPERRGHLFHDERSTSLGESLAPVLQRREASSLQVPRDDVRAAGLPPVVVDRHDVGMLEGRSRLSLLLESPHERRVRSDLLVEDLDRDVAAHTGLDRSEDDPGGTVVDLLQEPVTAERLTPQLEPGVLLQDPLVQPRELRRRIDPELVGEDLPDALIGGECLCLSPLPVEAEHELSPDALPERMLSDQDLGLADDARLLPDRQEGVDAVLTGHQPELIEARRLREQRAVIGDIRERGTTPEPERFFEHGGGDALVDRPDLPRVVDELLEAGGIQL